MSILSPDQKYIKNADTVPHTWVGQLINPGAYFTIPPNDEILWSSDDDVLTAIGAGIAVMARSNDGLQDIAGVNEAIDYIKSIIGADVVDVDGVRRYAIDMYSEAFQDERVLVSGADLANGYLDGKLSVGSSKLTKTIVNPGGDEDLQIDVDPSQINVGDLGDVDAGASDGDVLVFDGVDNTWKPEQLEVISDMDTVQARRSTTFTIPTSYGSLTFNNTDVETNDSVVKHNDTITSRINVFETGLYQFSYHVGAVVINGSTSLDFTLFARILKNGATLVNGSETQAADHYSGSGVYSEDPFVSCTGVIELTAGDYIELQIRYSGTSTPSIIRTNDAPTLVLTRMKGRKGDKGDTGAGSTITLEDDGVNKGNFDTLNFTGATVITDAGGGQADIALSTVFGSQFQKAESLSESTTTSTAYIQKLRLTTPSLPAGDYYVGWSSDVGTTPKNKKVGARIQENDTTNLSELDMKWDANTDADSYGPFSGHAIRTLSGVNTFDLDFVAPEATAKIRNARITLWRVS